LTFHSNGKVKTVHKEYGNEEQRGYGGFCCSGGHHGHNHFSRRFLTKAEKIERLENYTQELKNELAAVQERIKELKTSR
jgi:hypothetical protein